jgi:hypothetical protein
VRSDLPPGLQIAQACHGIAEFARDHRREYAVWIHESNYICVLAVPDESTLLDHAARLTEAQLKHSLVYEPDIEQHTAMVIAPGAYWSQLSQLPLAGREVATVG